MGVEHIDDLPPEERAAARKKVVDSRSKPPTAAQVKLAQFVLKETKDYSQVRVLITAAAQTIEDALKRT